MADKDRTLVLAFEAKLDKLQKDVDKGLNAVIRKMDKTEAAAAKTAAKMETSLGGAFTRVAGAATKAFAVIGGAAALKGLFNNVAEAINRFDELGDTAKRLGTTAGELVKWQHALEDADGSMEDFNASAEAFQGMIGKFVGQIGKTKGIQQALAQLGISREQIGSLATLQERLLLISDAIGKVEDRAIRAAIADKLGLRPMLPLLEQGREKILEMTAAFEDMAAAADEGVALTGDMSEQIKHLKDGLKYQSDNLFVRLGPVMIAFYENLGKMLDRLREMLQLVGVVERSEEETLKARAESWRNIWSSAKDDTFGVSGWLGGGGVAAGMYTEETALKNLIQAGNDWIAFKKRMAATPEAIKPSGGSLTPPPDAGEDGTKATAKALKDAATEAERAAKETERLSKAAKSVGIKLFGDNAEKQMEQLEIATAAAEELAQKQADFKEGFRQDFRNVVDDLLRGDLQGAAQSLGDAFAGRAIDKLSDMAFDMLWDGGFGDTMTSLFGDADLAQADLAITTQAATTALGQLTSAALAAAGAVGGGGGGNTGSWLSKAISAVTGSIGGGSSIPFPKAWASGGGAGAGDWGMVGEQGPELVKFGRAATVVPAMETSKLMRGGGAQIALTVQINNPTRDSLPFIEKQVAALQAGLPQMIRNVSNDAIARSQVRPRR